MVQYWRAAGMTYLKYSTTCAELVRQALKEPIRAKVLDRAGFSMVRGEWEGGKIVQRSTFALLFLAFCKKASRRACGVGRIPLLWGHPHDICLTVRAFSCAFRCFLIVRAAIGILRFLALIEPTGNAEVAAAK